MKGLPDDRRSASGPTSAAGTNCPSSRALAVVVPHSPYRIGADDPVGGNGGPVSVESDREWYADTVYAAAAQAGSQDWKAWFFGSLDTSNFITVDKPPASLWVVGLSGRIFGFSSASLLVPQALMGVGSVALVYVAVKRVASPAAGSVSGAVLAATPAAALMFKFDNPDALLVLLMTLAGYFVIRAMGTAMGRRAAMWVALAGVALGFAFHQGVARGDGIACTRRCVCDCRTSTFARSLGPLGDRRHGRCRIGRWVGIGSVAVAGGFSPVHRWVDQQQRHGLGAGIQRIGSTFR